MVFAKTSVFRRYVEVKEKIRYNTRSGALWAPLQTRRFIMIHVEDIELAKNARNNSYSPYSNFRVGVALRCKNGKVYTVRATIVYKDDFFGDYESYFTIIFYKGKVVDIMEGGENESMFQYMRELYDL